MKIRVQIGARARTKKRNTYPNELTAHLVVGESGMTLCGLNRDRLGGTLQESIDTEEYHLCVRCEVAAKSSDYEIPYSS